MKNWLTIGQFSKRIGVSAKALRLYERIGLLQSHTRGENGYRYYETHQIEKAKRLIEFKRLGFTLAEIKALLQADQELNSSKVASALKSRLKLVENHVTQLLEQKKQIEKILTSLAKNTEPLQAQQRRAIMSFYGQVLIVVTGYSGLDKTAHFIQQLFLNSGHRIPIVKWKKDLRFQNTKPCILIVPEQDLVSDEFANIHPDVIVVKDLQRRSAEIQKAYLKPYSRVGPHVTSVINADDRSAVELAGQDLLKKGRIFYFTKNGELKSQIKKIGGVVSDGEEVEIYGFNLKSQVINLKLKEIMTQEDELALLSSLGAIMTVGFDSGDLLGSETRLEPVYKNLA